MPQVLKVFFACALGAFIGALVALQLGAFWFVGVLVGGFTGYMVYEFQKVISAVKIAWNAVAGIRFHRWRPNKEYWKLYFRCFPPIFLSFSIGICWLILFLLMINDHTISGWHEFALSAILFEATALLASIMAAFDVDTAENTRFMDSLWKFSREGNPVSVLCWYLPRGILKGTVFCVKRIPAGAHATGKFCSLVFVQIHSDERLLCGVDAAIGAGIGWSAGNPLVGAIAGGLFGVVNYEIVSKRILKVIPQRAPGK